MVGQVSVLDEQEDNEVTNYLTQMEHTCPLHVSLELAAEVFG